MQWGCAATHRHFYIHGFYPLTRLAPADDSAVASHPLPQGGEG